MNSQEFVESKIRYLIKKFPTIQCRYEFHDYSYSHFIEILPEKIAETDSAFFNEKYLFFKEFILEYPSENIAFISPDDPIEINSKPYKGYLYDSFAIYKDECLYVGGINELKKNKYKLKKLEPSFSFQQQTKKHESVLNCDCSDCKLEQSKASRPFNENDITKFLADRASFKSLPSSIMFESEKLSEKITVESNMLRAHGA